MLFITKGSMSIPATRNAIAEKSEVEVEFDGLITEAYVALSGFRAEYVGGDHHIKQVKVEAEPIITRTPNGPIHSPNEVKSKITIQGKLWLKDKNADDWYNGSIYYTIFYKGIPASSPELIK